jgi:hypothetical protein
MAISNVSSGLRPGVCSSTTRPQAPFEGQMIFETDTNRVLVWDNSAWVMIADTNQPPGLQLVKAQTIGTSVSSVTVTNAFNSQFDNYRIIITGGTNSNVDAGANLQLGASTTGYYSAQGFITWTSDSLGYIRNNNASSWTNIGATFPNGSSLDIDLFNPGQARFTALSINSRSDYRTTGAASFGGGLHAVATAYTDFTFLPGAGTLTGGEIRVYGYRN